MSMQMSPLHPGHTYLVAVVVVSVPESDFIASKNIITLKLNAVKHRRGRGGAHMHAEYSNQSNEWKKANINQVEDVR